MSDVSEVQSEGKSAAEYKANAISISDINHNNQKVKVEENAVTRGGEFITLKHKRRRVAGSRARAISQDSVKGKSAKQELLDYIGNLKTEDEDFRVKLKQLAEYAFEWSHAVAHSLHPNKAKAQHSENLASTPKWINTWMMVFEKIAYYFSKQYPG